MFVRHPVTRRATVVADHPGPLDPGMLKTILKQAGISEDEFLDLLS